MLKCILCQSKRTEGPKQIMCSSCYAQHGDKAREAGHFLFGGVWSAAHESRDPEWDLSLRPFVAEAQNFGQLPKEFILSKAPKSKERDKDTSEKVQESPPFMRHETTQPLHAEMLKSKHKKNRSSEKENVRRQSQTSPGLAPTSASSSSSKSSGSDGEEKSRLVELVRLKGHGVKVDLSNVSPLPQEPHLLAGTVSNGRNWYRYSPDKWHVMALARGDSLVREDVQVAMTVTHAGSWDESERSEGFASAPPDSDGLYWFRAVEPLVEGHISLSFALDEGESEKSGVEPLRHEIDTEIAQQQAKREAPPTKRATKRPVPAPTRARGQTQLLLTKPDGSSAFARQGQKKIQASSSSNGSDRSSGTRQTRGEKRNVEDEGGEGEDEGWISGDVAGRSGGTQRKSQKQLRLSSHFSAR